MIEDDNNGSIVVVNAGGQYCHLIARRVREAGVRSIIRDGKVSLADLTGAKGIIISGGPNSVYEPDAPEITDNVFKANVPILGLCYGHQFLAQKLNGIVSPGRHREYGEALMEVIGQDTILSGLPSRVKVWMSHGDEVTAAPKGFEVLAKTPSCDVAAMANLNRRIFGLQFHPEVNETQYGRTVIENFLFRICHCEKEWKPEKLIDVLRKNIVTAAHGKHVLFFVSGGVDSTVAFTLCSEALGPERVTGVFVDTGFMRKGEREELEATFKERGWHNMRFENAEKDFVNAVAGIADPEQKRHIIGDCFLEVQRRLETELGLETGSWLLGQGTIYPDTIESGGSQFAAAIKTHHNRVPAIQKMISEGLILEPIRDLYKDEVRDVGRILGLPDFLIEKHPFPGPGLAVRCLCSTADIEIKKPHDIQKITGEAKLEGWMVPISTVGVQGDYRTYSNLVILDGKADLETYATIARQITREIRNTNRIAFLVSSREGFDLSKAFVHKEYINKERLNLLREADAICQTMLRDEGLMDLVWQFPVILLPLGSDSGETIALRPVSSSDAMTAKHSNLPLDFIKKIGTRLTKISGIEMVLYDVTDKPPATIEWE
jgi:GMP synthase (glutamine-hydrolysing)